MKKGPVVGFLNFRSNGLIRAYYFFKPLIWYIHALTPTLHTHTSLTPHMYKQTYNYTQIFRPRPSRDHRNPP